MHEVKPDAKKIAMVSGVLFLTLFALVLYYFGTPPSVLLASLAKSGAVLAAVTAFWVMYERWGWRMKWTRLFGWLCDTPDLQGRWEGTVCRDGPGQQPHRFVLEISQTFSGLKFRTFGERSGGESLSVLIVSKDDQGLMWEALCIWRTKARRLEDPGKEDWFLGTSTWQISSDPTTESMTMKDSYFTSRQTTGRIEVEWKGRTLQGRY